MLAAAGLVVLLGAAIAAADEACTRGPGDRRKVVVSFAPPEGGLVAGLTMIVDYPERKVLLPGAGTNLAKGTIGGTPTGAVVGLNDLDDEVKIVLAASGAIEPGAVAEISFDACEGGGAIAASDFACRVLDAADPVANLVRDVTCRVSVP
jgi:hypothetical protein